MSTVRWLTRLPAHRHVGARSAVPRFAHIARPRQDPFAPEIVAPRPDDPDDLPFFHVHNSQLHGLRLPPAPQLAALFSAAAHLRAARMYHVRHPPYLAEQHPRALGEPQWGAVHTLERVCGLGLACGVRELVLTDVDAALEQGHPALATALKHAVRPRGARRIAQRAVHGGAVPAFVHDGLRELPLQIGVCDIPTFSRTTFSPPTKEIYPATSMRG